MKMRPERRKIFLLRLPLFASALLKVWWWEELSLPIYDVRFDLNKTSITCKEPHPNAKYNPLTKKTQVTREKNMSKTLIAHLFNRLL